MSRLKELIERLKEIRAEVGYADFDEALRAINRERLQSPRMEKRKKFAWGVIQRLYEKQAGVCPFCQEIMVLLKTKRHLVEVDHINPNRPDFNDPKNLQLLHRDCNRQKSSMSMMDQAKRLGVPMTTILNGGVESEVTE